ncbi:MAG TPA: hypothetical protein V6D25_06450 [Leptolyngbyaceae cyanobacterium]
MLQIIDLENNEMFTQVSSEESASVSGGNLASAANYLAVTNALIPGLRNSATQLNTAFLLATNPQISAHGTSIFG